MNKVRHCGPLPPISGTVALLIDVPEPDRADIVSDVAECYCVETGDDIPGGCIIWGRHRGVWYPNVSGRWLVSRFIEGASKMLDNKDRGGDGWWSGWEQLEMLVSVAEKETDARPRYVKDFHQR